MRVGRQAFGAYDDALWTSAREHALLRGGPTWQRVSPALPSLPLDGAEFRDVRHVAGFLIGETDNTWSNASLAQAVSRLYTGKAITLRLVRRIGATALPPTPSRALPFGAGREAVLGRAALVASAPPDTRARGARQRAETAPLEPRASTRKKRETEQRSPRTNR